jgi:hypothetical protein
MFTLCDPDPDPDFDLDVRLLTTDFRLLISPEF